MSTGSDLYNALRQMGFPEGAAAGIVGNWSVESAGFDPAVISGARRGDGGTARGLKQWHPDRWANFLSWIRANNIPDGPETVHAQFGFALQEFRDEGIYNQLLHITDPVEAAALVMRKDERPADQSDKAAQTRANAGIAIAKSNGSALDKIKGLPGDIAGAAGGAVSNAAGSVADTVLAGVSPILWKALFVALGVGLLGFGVSKAFDVKVPGVPA